MGKTYDAISSELKDFISRQQMFFVATAPLAGDGLINLSPKGLDSLRVLDEQTVAYADLTGSGVETIAHVKENGRIVLMFCAFDGPPNIVRLQGRGEIIESADPEFDRLRRLFPGYPGLRSFVRVHCDRISDSCGFAVPKYEFVEHRSQLISWAEQQGPDGVTRYQEGNNVSSLDGLPGLSSSTEKPA